MTYARSRGYRLAWCTWAKRFGVRGLEWRAGQVNHSLLIIKPSSGLEASLKYLLWVDLCNFWKPKCSRYLIKFLFTGTSDVPDVWEGASEVTGWPSLLLLSWFLHDQHIQLQKHHTTSDSITGLVLRLINQTTLNMWQGLVAITDSADAFKKKSYSRVYVALSMY